jgi:hypothetical protein
MFDHRNDGEKLVVLSCLIIEMINKIGAGAYGLSNYRNDGEKLVMSVNDSA